ncbi:MAG: hypothetical protein AB1333_03070 [Patescibacteria group bacterium]
MRITEQVRELLEELMDNKWHLQPPRGVGRKTVDFWIERNWIKTKTVPIASKNKVQSFFMPLQITKKGRIVYLNQKYQNKKRLPKELIEYRLKQLRQVVGVQVVRSLQTRKSFLFEWRRSTPHNWWVENRRGKMLWHSSDDRSIRQIPDSMLFEIVKHSKNLIITGSWLAGRDEGRPEETIYRLKKIYS